MTHAVLSGNPKGKITGNLNERCRIIIIIITPWL
jgi:hypothetical protein